MRKVFGRYLLNCSWARIISLKLQRKGSKGIEIARRFREDLHWRLAVLSLHLSPLRERKEDIWPLSEFLISKYNKQLGKHIRGVTKSCL